MKALSIRQRRAEAILWGAKPIEFRFHPANVRGRVHIYTSLGRYLTRRRPRCWNALSVTWHATTRHAAP